VKQHGRPGSGIAGTGLGCTQGRNRTLPHYPMVYCPLPLPQGPLPLAARPVGLAWPWQDPWARSGLVWAPRGAQTRQRWPV